jgi:hypothetical protein
VIIGPGLRHDAEAGRPVVHRASCFDGKGQEDDPTLGVTHADDDLRLLIGDIHAAHGMSDPRHLRPRRRPRAA